MKRSSSCMRLLRNSMTYGVISLWSFTCWFWLLSWRMKNLNGCKNRSFFLSVPHQILDTASSEAVGAEKTLFFPTPEFSCILNKDTRLLFPVEIFWPLEYRCLVVFWSSVLFATFVFSFVWNRKEFWNCAETDGILHSLILCVPFASRGSAY